MNDEDRDILLEKIGKRIGKINDRTIRLEEQSKSSHTFMKGMNDSNTNDHATLSKQQKETNSNVGENRAQILKLWGTLKGVAWGVVGAGILIGGITKILEIW